MTAVRSARGRELAVRAAVSGFYAVLDRDDAALARTLVGPGRARVLQLRIKPAAPDDLMRVARIARAVCDASGAALVINDRVDLALAVGADGVHLGQLDLPVDAVRRWVGDRLWIGASTHDLDQIARAKAHGADYVGFGPVFETRTKRDPDPVQGVDGLAAAVEAAGEMPVVAIGGISPRDAASIYATGAAAICAISAVNEAADVTAAALAMGRKAPWLARGARPRYSILRWSYQALHDTGGRRRG